MGMYPTVRERRERDRERAVEHERRMGWLHDHGLTREPDDSSLHHVRFTEGSTTVLVRGMDGGHLTLDAYWLEDGQGRGPLFAPKRYEFLPTLVRDIERVLADSDAVYTLGSKYVDDEYAKAVADKVREKRAEIARLLDVGVVARDPSAVG